MGGSVAIGVMLPDNTISYFLTRMDISMFEVVSFSKVAEYGRHYMTCPSREEYFSLDICNYEDTYFRYLVNADDSLTFHKCDDMEYVLTCTRIK